MNKPCSKITLLFAILILPSLLSSQVLERKDVEDKFKWDLSVLYQSKEEWKNHKEELSRQAEKLADYKGRLAESPETLKEALDLYFRTWEGYGRLATYAKRLSDQDTRVSENQSLYQEASSLATKISENSSYIDPEILQMSEEKINQFMEENDHLKLYNKYFEDLQRTKEHTLSPEQEQILASAGMVTSTPVNVYSIFNNAEKPNPEITLSDGKKAELTASNFVRYRASENRENRAKVFEEFFMDYKNYQNTLGANYVGKLKSDYFYAKNRKYDSALEYVLDGNNIPPSVYKNLVDQINENLPTLHRFLDLKKRMLGVETLHYYDLYTPLVEKVEMNYEVEKGQKVLLDVLEPMGAEYTSTLNKAYNDRWIDYFPTRGKVSGAYSAGAYGAHPYILMNWTDDFNSVSTLAHELGHTMHSYFTNKNQPYVYSNYSRGELVN